MPRYVLGLDFGTESGRVMLVDVETGEEAAWTVVDYPHGVLDRQLPNGALLESESALQDPQDYLTVLDEGVSATLHKASAKAEDVVGIGVSFTACTVLPTRRNGEPLCIEPEFCDNPHAWVKLWKHHAAQPQAERINQAARSRSEPFLTLYGGGYSSEWMFSKVLETLEKAPEVYAAAERYLEAGDWLIWQLTGRESRSECAAGYKGMWRKGEGYPGPDFFAALHPGFRDVVAEKIEAPLTPLGEAAGELTAEVAERLGLRAGVPVAAFVIDAHAGAPACGLLGPGRMAMIMGTSNCHMLLSESERQVPGVAGLVQDGILPGFWGYEAGQPAVGDLFAWFFRAGIPAQLAEEAAERGVTPADLLTDQAARLRPGESGLVALDWWNGCRSILMDAELSGVLVGATLATRPAEVYRALVEAAAFGTRKIVEAFEANGAPVREIVACGGLAERSPFVVQTFANVCGRPIRLPRSFQASGLGAAIHAAVAAGVYGDFPSAVEAMADFRPHAFEPDAEAGAVYDEIYQVYNRLHDVFGREERALMSRLRALRRAATAAPS